MRSAHDQGTRPTSSSGDAIHIENPLDMKQSVEESGVSAPKKRRAQGLRCLLWTSPLLLFLGINVMTALMTGLGNRWAVALLVETFILGVAYIVSWFFNDIAPREDLGTIRFLVTSLVMLAAQFAMVFSHMQLGIRRGIIMLCFLAAASALQSPARLTLPSLAGVVSIAAAQSLLLPDESNSLAVLAVTMTSILALLARNRLDQEHQRDIDRRQRLSLTKERERTERSRELLETLSEDVTSIVAHVDLACRLLDAGLPDKTRAHLEELVSLSRTAHTELRTIVESAPAATPAVEVESARTLLAASGVGLDLVRLGEPRPGTTSTMVAHVIRESCQNALSHSAPSRVQVTLRHDGVSVSNDGFTESNRARHDRAPLGGLGRIRERLGYRGTLTWGADGDHWLVDLEVTD